MPVIKNKYYKRFLTDGFLDTDLLDQKELIKGLNRINGKHQQEARCLVILLYYSGARPNEVLRLTAGDIYKDEKNPNYLIVRFPSSKRGLARKLEFTLDNPLIKEVFTYAIGLYNNMLLFYHFTGKYRRVHVTKTGETREYEELTARLRYHFKKWFPDYNLYYFRHHRFSRLLDKGARLEDIRQMKGSRSITSVLPYSHMNKKTRRYLAKIND